MSPRPHPAAAAFSAREGERLVERLRRREHRLRVPRGERPPIGRAARLHEHRMPLRRPRQIQRPVHAKMRAAMRDRPHLRRIDEAAARLVADERVVVPAIPQRLHDVDEFGRARIARRVIGRRVEAEIARGAGVGRRHDVPPRAAAAHMIERSEAAREIERFVVARRRGADEADARRRGGDRREHDRRFERGDRTEVDLIDDRCVVREKHRVELRGLRDPRDAHVMRDIDERARIGVVDAPRGRHETRMQDVDVQMQLTALRPFREGCHR
ncbi:Uncharacterised protein [Burkholderia pseudomallei]|nr:Uncharacterised protein [Burkholderia pseudomallei]